MTTTPTLKLHNTLTRTKQDFTPLDPKKVGMYVCGITPYDDAHIGHARVYVVFDVLFRLLRHIYGENAVNYVRNFTDIDDKIITRAAEKGGDPIKLAEHFMMSFHEDMMKLNVLMPTAEPRVSTSIPGIVKMVDQLIAKGFAYETASGDVIYRTAKFPKYGALARRKLEDQQHGARVKEDAEKENPNDFVLWKANAKSAAKLEQAFNPAEYAAKHFSAPGRPGWHIECSVMSAEHLGLPFDIHGGGEDLIFPHHCCEIAQTEALMAPGQDMARYWLHNSFITVNGTKMSKSLGNFTTIKDALRMSTPGAIRIWLLQTHYRKPVDFSVEALIAAQNRYVGYIKTTFGAFAEYGMEILDTDKLPPEFINALADDLNTPIALSVIDKEPSILRKSQMLNFLGIDKVHGKVEVKKPLNINEESLMQARFSARAAKNWAESDRLRDELKAKGIIVEDKPDGTTTWRRA
jgi:cysteinyl-tRNA synthetase